jgi:hypothetical protein
MKVANLHCEGPGASLSNSYLTTRYVTLRKPLGFPPGAANLPDDHEAIHAYVTVDDEVVAVGRIHLIPADSKGGGADTAEEGAAHCPDFQPLSEQGWCDAQGGSLPDLNSIRPAVQVRQMGTLEGHLRCGYGARVLAAIEVGAASQWGECTGFLQARTGAVKFYESQGWVCFGGEYSVEGIGAHHSMWKRLGGGE